MLFYPVHTGVVMGGKISGGFSRYASPASTPLPFCSGIGENLSLANFIVKTNMSCVRSIPQHTSVFPESFPGADPKPQKKTSTPGAGYYPDASHPDNVEDAAGAVKY